MRSSVTICPLAAVIGKRKYFKLMIAVYRHTKIVELAVKFGRKRGFFKPRAYALGYRGGIYAVVVLTY